MIPILYNTTETKYLNDGLGQMFDVQSCIVSEEANGSFTLDMEYPKNGSLVNHILKGNQILAKPNDIDKEHVFRILEVDKSTSNSTISITATSITNDEGMNIVRAIKVSNKNAADAMKMIQNNLVLKSRFEYLSDITTIKSFENGHMTPLSAVIGDENSLYNFYGGELKRTNTSIQLLQRRGRDKVTTIEKGKNASGITHNISYNGKYTSIIPYVALTGLTSTEKKNIDYYQVRKVELGSGLTVVLTRTRNKSVIFQCDMNLTSEFKEDGVYKLDKNIPEELCPIAATYITASVMVGANVVPERKLAFLIYPDGRVFISTKGMGAKPHRIISNGEWLMSQKACEMTEQAILDKHPNKDRNTIVYGDIVKCPGYDEIGLNYIVPIDVTEKDDQGEIKYDTVDAINEHAKDFFKRYPETYLPTITTKIDVLSASDDVISQIENLNLFDTADVYVPEIDVETEVMVVRYEYDVLRERMVTIEAESGKLKPNDMSPTPKISYSSDLEKLKDEINKQIVSTDTKIFGGSRATNGVFSTEFPPSADEAIEGDIWWKKNEFGELSQYVFDGKEWVLSVPADFGRSVEARIQQANDESKEFWERKDTEQNSRIDSIYQEVGIIRDLSNDAKQQISEIQNTDISAILTDLDKAKTDIATVSSIQGPLTGRITKVESNLLIANNSINLKVNSTDFNPVQQQVTSNTSRLSVVENGIFETVSGTKINKLDSLKSDYTTYKSTRSMTDSEIRTTLSTEINGVTTRFNSTKDTVDSFVRTIGTNVEASMSEALARTVMTSSMFENEVKRVEDNVSILSRSEDGIKTSDPYFNSGVNNISGHSGATVTRASATVNGGISGYRINVSGTATVVTSYRGGLVMTYGMRSNAEYVVKFKANIPTHAYLHTYVPGTTSGYTVKWLTDNTGKGRVYDYAFVVYTGTAATLGNKIVVDAKSPSASAFTWYCEYFDIIDTSRSHSIATSTKVTQLADSYAVKTLNSNGQILAQLNLTDGNVKIAGKLVSIDGTVSIQNGVIKDAHIADLSVNKITGMTADFLKARIGQLKVSDISGITASFLQSVIGTAFITWMTGKIITATNNNSILNLDDGTISFGSDNSGMFRRGNAMYTESGMMFQQHELVVSGVTRGVSRIIIGGDRDGVGVATNWTTGMFNGIIIETIKNVLSTHNTLADKTTVVSDRVHFQQQYGDIRDVGTGWAMITYPPSSGGNVSLSPVNINPRNSLITTGDIRLMNNDTQGEHLRVILERLFHNVQEIANRTGGRHNLYVTLTNAMTNVKG